MADEFKHVTVGTELTQGEYESVTGHAFASQATGDIMYASSATQLSRLGVGATDTILSVQGGIPTWRTPANILTDLSGQATATFSFNSQSVSGINVLSPTSIEAFSLTGKLTAGAIEIEGSNFDINDGDISAVTISGSLTWSASQNLNSQALTNVNIDSGDISAVTISGSLTWSSAQNLNSQALTNVNIDSGDISAVTISGDLTWSTAQTGLTLTSPAINGTITTTGLTMPAITLGGAIAGGDQTWTGVGNMTFTAGSILASGDTNTNTLLLRANDTTFITLTTAATDVCTLEAVTLKGTLLADGTVTLPAFTLGGTLDADGQNLDNVAIIYGDSTYLRIGDASATSHSLASEDDLMVTGKLEVDEATYFDNAVSFGGTIDFGSFAASNANIDSGSIDNVTISGGATVTIGGGLTWSAAQNLNSQALTNVNIDSGTIDGVTITSPTLSGTTAGTFTIGGTVTINAFTLGGKLAGGGTEIEGTNFDIDGGDISAVTISGGLTWSSAQDLGSQALTNVNIDSGDISAATISGSLTWSAVQNLNSQALTNVNIDSGTIDGVTITSPALSGTTTGTFTVGGTVTINAFTLGGTVSGGNNVLSAIGGISIQANGSIYSVGDASALNYRGGTNAVGKGSIVQLFGADNTGQIIIATPNVAKDADITRLTLSGVLATGVATWANVTHTGIVLSGSLTVNGNAIDAGGADLQVNTTGDWRGFLGQLTTNGSAAFRIKTFVNSSSPAASDNLLSLMATGKDDGATTSEYGEFRIMIEDETAAGGHSGKMGWYNFHNGSSNEAMRLSAAGILSVDATANDTYNHPTDWNHPVTTFDKYDDALLLKQGIQQRGLDMLCEVGVFSKKDTGSGYMMNVQAFNYLLAGGIYQTRELLDNTKEELATRIEQLESKLMLLEGETNDF